MITARIVLKNGYRRVPVSELERLRKISILLCELDDLLSEEPLQDYEILKKQHIEPLRQQMTRRLRKREQALMAGAKR